MKTQLITLLFLASVSAFAADPEVIVTTKATYNGYATVGGHVTSGSKGPIGVSIENGDIRYSTIADPSGAWAIVFRQAALDFSVKAWLLDDPSVESQRKERLQ